MRNDFGHFTEALGLEDAQCQAWSSPYDYPNQAMLYVPHGLPQPNAPGHTDAVVDAALPLIRANRGRAFLLCTSLRAVTRAAERLKHQLAAAGDPFPVLTQGDVPRPALLDAFRRAGNAVLVGSHSFWEGIDVKGDALTLVVIDKLPFAPPDDPVLAKRLELLAQEGGNPFMSHQVPQAIIALKQGAGRLIRGETDRVIEPDGNERLGVLFITDTLQVWHAVVILSIHGFAGVLWNPSSQLMIHDIAGRQHLQSAVRLMSMSRTRPWRRPSATRSLVRFGTPDGAARLGAGRRACPPAPTGTHAQRFTPAAKPLRAG